MKNITIVSRVYINWPANLGVVKYLNKNTNLYHPGDTEANIDWSKTFTMTIPNINEYCLKQLAQAVIDYLEADIRPAGKITKIEVFDPATKQLLIEVAA